MRPTHLPQTAGGETKAGLALHDTMRMMPYEFQTVNMGMCAQVREERTATSARTAKTSVRAHAIGRRSL